MMKLTPIFFSTRLSDVTIPDVVHTVTVRIPLFFRKPGQITGALNAGWV